MEQTPHKQLAVWQFTTLDDWRAWLEKNHARTQTGVWLKIAKKGANTQTISYNDAREGALCYGWIDSLPNKLDESFYLLKVTPRRRKSVWSKINVALCEGYIADGHMMPSGLAEVTAAKADGRWDKAY